LQEIAMLRERIATNLAHYRNGFIKQYVLDQPDHPEVVKTMQEIARRIRQAGGTMQLDVMQGAWVSDMLLDGIR
jgi:hypothetical protein